MAHRLLYSKRLRNDTLSPLQERPAPRLQPAPGTHAVEESLLQEYLRTLSRHRMMVVLSALGGLAIALLLGLGSEPVYRTRTSLDIRSLNGDFMDTRAVDPTSSNTPAEADTNLQTQIKLLQSDTLLQQVVDRLMQQPHPSQVQQQDLISIWMRRLHIGAAGTLPYAKFVDYAAQHVKVKPLGLTRLVEITCDSYDARFSAQFCNTLTNTFEEQDLQNRASEAQKTSTWLTRQVADVRERAEESQKRLETAVGNDGLMLSQTPTSVGEERLRSLQDELVKAQAARMQDEAEASLTHSAPAETLPGVQDSPDHRTYEARLADLRSQVAALVPPLTEQNPKVIHLRSQIAAAEAGLASTASATSQRENNEYAAARHREELLQVAMGAQQSKVSSDLQKAAQVSLLRRELDSEQQLYQTLLQRAKEAGFASAMQASMIRVVDAAKPPRTAAAPRRKLSGGVGLALGAVLGIGFGFYKDRNHKVFRTPGEAQQRLYIPELGVIPSTRSRKFGGLARTTSTLSLSAEPQAKAGEGEAIALTRWNDDFSIAAEAYRSAVFSILTADTAKRTHSYVVTSPSAEEGKTTVLSNLGIALGKSKLRVVLVDGDMRRPALHHAFGIPNDSGLREILRGDISLGTASLERLTMRTAYPNVAVIPAGKGSEDAVELLHSPYLGDLVDRLSREFDIVLIDSPPILHMADARVLSRQTDGTILVLRAGTTSYEAATGVRDLLDRDGIPIVGTILNAFNPASDGRYSYYQSYSRYQSASAEHAGTGR